MEQDPFNNSNTEKLTEFLYTDNSEAGLRPGRESADSGAIIFRCNAHTIEDADKMF